jgi:hypothetical protein
MQARRFTSVVHGELSLDLCFDCSAIWFDPYESAQLAPGAVIELFRLIHAHRDGQARPLADRLSCPHCLRTLTFTHDVQRTNRIVYYRCEQGHGRLSTFLQFLREKNFVRDLSVAELAHLRERVAQVRCSSCGAPVDLGRDAACSYCGAPVSVLDAEAVDKALAALSEAERRRTTLDPERIADALLGARQARKPHSPWLQDAPVRGEDTVIVDLVADGLAALFD